MTGATAGDCASVEYGLTVTRPRAGDGAGRPGPDDDLATAYDLVFGNSIGKSYATEAYDIAELIHQRNPAADSLLDVACGSGLHLAHLRGVFDHVEGLEISDAMRRKALRRLPGISVHPGDMRDFRLDRTFSAVTCLFSAIGYTRSVAELRQTLDCLAAHLEPGGVLVLEPWYTPDQWTPETVHTSVARDGDRQLTGMCYSRQDGHTSIMTMHYLLGEPGADVRYWIEEHVMTLFTEDEYHDAVQRAGFGRVEWLPGWYDVRPRIVATKD
ncbi:class I SAM-dependent DNA methyltransferase [Catellatospora tritici]|uniref:class I SAM-dependent DNA methyltransferase n=1 Tax=Catellatospora tritici TaxID=2851566 RepID=UPI001C2CE60E|nr:class I SAM-dependent methyltransferase [Catellatospora tritici]MBV1855226.1 class I SAM-dependent methyltransferase [Catellatospora tritici]